MNKMQAGENIVVERDAVDLTITWLPHELAIEFRAFVFETGGKPSAADDFIASTKTAERQVFHVDLSSARDIEKVVIVAGANMAKLFDLDIELEPLASFVPRWTDEMQTLILGELYWRNGQWKFRAVGQGFKYDLETLTASYGMPAAAAKNDKSTVKTAGKDVGGAAAYLGMLKNLSIRWILYSLGIFLGVELLLAGLFGKVVGRFLPHTLSYALEVLLILSSFLVGGAVAAVLSRQVRIIEPALGALLLVILTLSISFFSPYTFMGFTWLKVLAGGGVALLLAGLGAYFGEKLSAKMGNRDAQRYFGKHS
ncbi:MAG: TerD family protein [Gammaproteobacteria bacterium]